MITEHNHVATIVAVWLVTGCLVAYFITTGVATTGSIIVVMCAVAATVAALRR